MDITNKEIIQISKSKPKKISILCTFKIIAWQETHVCGAEGVFRDSERQCWQAMDSPNLEPDLVDPDTEHFFMAKKIGHIYSLEKQ